MKVNFAQFPIYEGIKKEKRIASDIRESYGDWMYKNMGGIKAHLLSEKIYTSDTVGIELDEEEIVLIRQSTEALTGVVADSINDYLNKKEKEAKNED